MHMQTAQKSEVECLSKSFWAPTHKIITKLKWSLVLGAVCYTTVDNQNSYQAKR